MPLLIGMHKEIAMKFDTVSPYYAAMINNSYLNPVNSTFSGQSYQVADGFGKGLI